MKKVFAEIGFGNDTFFSTEFEEGSSEYRIPKFVMPSKVRSLYFRLWIFKKVFILSTNHGIEIKDKDRNRFKILFGISGESKMLNFASKLSTSARHNVWVNGLIIIGSIFVIASTYIQGINTGSVSVALQNGITMLQVAANTSVTSVIYTNNLLVRNEDCGYFNKGISTIRCQNSKDKLNETITELEANIQALNIIEGKYTIKINELSNNYEYYKWLENVLAVAAILSNSVALIINQCGYKRDS